MSSSERTARLPRVSVLVEGPGSRKALPAGLTLLEWTSGPADDVVALLTRLFGGSEDVRCSNTERVAGGIEWYGGGG